MSAFEALKERLCSEAVLKVFDPGRETELHTEASKVGYGACLLQKYGNQWFPVFYLSKQTTPAHKNYTSYELEVSSITYALQKLLGVYFRIVTDCNAFNLSMKKRELNSRVARWALQLEEYNCEVVHRAGSGMRHVDALSRYPVVGWYLPSGCT